MLFYCSAIKSVLESSGMIFYQNLTRNLSEDLERIQRGAERIVLPDSKHCDTLKIAKIDTLYDRGESLSLKLFYEISHANNHKFKLGSLLPPRSKC